jgi:pyruvate/2-oxoglutarate dehydrogenase complex dihydrolipoamide dehydrogenase (E3) component
MANQRFDVVIIGAGPAGETVASRTADAGLRTAIVERELIGGECAYWACIPSKTLLRPGEVVGEAVRTAGTGSPSLSFDKVAPYRDEMIRHLDDVKQVKSYEDEGVSVFKGEGSLLGPNEVAVGDETIETERIVIATGSDSLIPPIDGLEQAGYWTNREATTLKEVPASVTVMGGGPVGVELAQMLRRFGSEVHLVEAAERLLSREDERVSELLLEALREDEIDVRLDAKVTSVSASGNGRTVRFGDQEVGADELVVAVGRKPRLDELSLERAGIEPGEKGIEVDERCRAGEGIWAIGDVTGVMPFTHVGKYQGRVACADILGRPARAEYGAVPRVVFSDPEVAAVGMTEEQATAAGIEPVTSHIRLSESIARPWTYETDPRGELCVIADPKAQVLVGAWAVGPLAGEWIHYAALAIKSAVPLSVLRDTVAQFPTYTEAYLNALEALPTNSG